MFHFARTAYFLPCIVIYYIMKHFSIWKKVSTTVWNFLFTYFHEIDIIGHFYVTFMVRTKMCKTLQVKYIIGLKLICLKWFIEYWLLCKKLQKYWKVVESSSNISNTTGLVQLYIFIFVLEFFLYETFLVYFRKKNISGICGGTFHWSWRHFLEFFTLFYKKKLSNGAIGTPFLTASFEVELALIGLTKI